MAVAEGFDMAFVLKKDLQNVVRRRIPPKMFKDSRSLFDVIMKNSSTSKRRLMIDISAARQAYGHLEISNIGLIRSTYNVTDAFRKGTKCVALESVVRNGSIRLPVAEWVIRRDVTRHDIGEGECRSSEYSNGGKKYASGDNSR